MHTITIHEVNIPARPDEGRIILTPMIDGQPDPVGLIASIEPPVNLPRDRVINYVRSGNYEGDVGHEGGVAEYNFTENAVILNTPKRTDIFVEPWELTRGPLDEDKALLASRTVELLGHAGIEAKIVE